MGCHTPCSGLYLLQAKLSSVAPGQASKERSKDPPWGLHVVGGGRRAPSGAGAVSGSECAPSAWPLLGGSGGGWWCLSQPHDGVSRPFFLPPTIKEGLEPQGGDVTDKGDCCLSQVGSPGKDHAIPLGGLKPHPLHPWHHLKWNNSTGGEVSWGNPVCSLPQPLASESHDGHSHSQGPGRACRRKALCPRGDLSASPTRGPGLLMGLSPSDLQGWVWGSLAVPRPAAQAFTPHAGRGAGKDCKLVSDQLC